MNPFLASLFGKRNEAKKPIAINAQQRRSNHEIARAQRESKARIKQFFKRLFGVK